MNAIFWHRRDLRINDNCGLYHAFKNAENVLPIFIFDTTILSKLKSDDQRVIFIHQEVKALRDKYAQSGVNFHVYIGDPQDLIPTLAKKYNCSAVYTNRDYEPDAIKRDNKIEKSLKKKDIKFLTFKDQVILEHDQVLKNDGLPYTVFTPYKNKWLETFKKTDVDPYASEQILKENSTTFPEIELPSLKKIGFDDEQIFQIPSRKIDKKLIKSYDQTRDFPAIEGTSRLGVHLRFGTISIRELTKVALKENTVFLSELIWREFYQMILFHYPHTVNKAFKTNYDFIVWENNESQFKAWCEGKTGYPMVDAGMRQLNETGYMHNRVRMVVASFLSKHLLIDWRWGEAYFAEKLLDYECASNIGGWQWAAGCGCDAAPYFRVFNPQLQQQKFDKDMKYIRTWIPEFDELNYPQPIVEHKMARIRAIERYKKALNE